MFCCCYWSVHPAHKCVSLFPSVVGFLFFLLLFETVSTRAMVVGRVETEKEEEKDGGETGVNLQDDLQKGFSLVYCFHSDVSIKM